MAHDDPPLNQNFAEFDKVFERAYGWTLDYDDKLHGLVAGDMGYEETSVKLVDLLSEALERGHGHSPTFWQFEQALAEVVRLARVIIGPTA